MANVTLLEISKTAKVNSIKKLDVMIGCDNYIATLV